MDLAVLEDLIGHLPRLKILAVGDLMVDRFVYGEVRRVSAEAPIPILARTSQDVMLGGSGNVARNIVALGARCTLVGVVGCDEAGREAASLIDKEPRLEGALASDPERPTTIKTRYVSSGQQLLRVDTERVAPLGQGIEGLVVQAIRRTASDCQAILLSDYGKGVVTQGVIDACLAAAADVGAILVVDSKARGFQRYGRADVVKPNAAELAHATDMPTRTDAEVEAALERALRECQCRAILVTRAADGMSLATRDGPVLHLRRPPVEVFDTSGAGDTALAALGLALAADATLPKASEFALLVSSVAVEKAGTATVSAEDALEAARTAHRHPVENKIASMAQMEHEVARWRRRGLKIGFTNGCFDILHRGHLAYLTQARGWCDRLVVGVNTDRSVAAAKGASRPINDLEARALVLAGLGCVDLVTPFDEDTPLRLIEAARPDVLVKGSDYALEDVVGGDLVRAYGGEVRLADFVSGASTTAILRKVSERP